MTWEQVTGGEPNPFTVVHTSASTYSASNEELVITEGDTVELPAPVAEGIVGVRDFDQRPRVTTPSGTVQGYSERWVNTIDTIYFVSDGSDWYTVSDQDYVWNNAPDTASIQYYASSWDVGETEWVDYVEDDGMQNATMTGDPQSATMSDGSESIAFDTSDHALHDIPVSGSELNSFTLEFAVSWSHSNDANGYTVVNSDGQLLQFRINVDSSFASHAGNFLFRLQGSDNFQMGGDISGTNPGLNDGNRHDITIRVNDASQSDFDIIIDGQIQDVDQGFTEQINTLSEWDTQIAIGAGNDDGTIVSSGEINFGAIRWHNSAIPEQTIGNYE